MRAFIAFFYSWLLTTTLLSQGFVVPRWMKQSRSGGLLHAAPDSENPYDSIPFQAKEQGPVIREHVERVDGSNLLASDVSSYGMRTVLAERQLSLKNYDEAVRLAKEAMDIAKHVHEPDNIYAAYAEGIWADALYSMGSFQESAWRFREALKMYERHYRSSGSPEAVELVGSSQLVAWHYLSNQDYANATRAWSTALSLTERMLGPNSTDVAACMTNLALSHMSNGEMGFAVEALLRRALKIYEQLEGNTHTGEKLAVLRSRVRTILGHLYYKRGDDDHAIQCYQHVDDAYRTHGVSDVSTASALECFAIICWERGDVWRAEDLLLEAQEVMWLNNVPDHSDVKKRVKALLDGIHNGDRAPLERLKRKNVFTMY